MTGTRNIGFDLRALAAASPDAPAVIAPDVTLTLGKLWRLVDCFACRMSEAGIGRTARVGLATGDRIVAIAGMFLGFNKSVGGGNLVLGGEIAMQGFTPGGDSSHPDPTEPDSDEYGISNAIDLKMRVGTAMTMGSSPVLLYGFAGMSSVTSENYWSVSYTNTGINFGLGAEMKVGSNFGIGLEYLNRSMTAYDGGGYDDGSNSHQQLSLRAAFHF